MATFLRPLMGVLARRVQQAGAVTGFLCGLALVSWIGFGGPKPPRTGLEVSLSNCSNTNFTEPAGETLTVTQPDQYFYLYRISYAWTSAIGFSVTVLVGTLASELVRRVRPSQTTVDNILLARCIQPKTPTPVNL